MIQGRGFPTPLPRLETVDVPTCPVFLLSHLRLGVLDSLAISCFVNQPHCKGFKIRHYYVTSSRSIWVEEYEIPMNVMEISDINLRGLQHVVYASYRNRDHSGTYC